MTREQEKDGDITIHRMLLEMGEIQLQLTALILADLEAISSQVMALNPAAGTKSQELTALYAENHADALSRAQTMIENIRERVAEAEIPRQEQE